MFMPIVCVVLPASDRAQLAQVVANGNTPQKRAVRASILLMLADHVPPSQIARRLALSRNHVHDWTRRYVAAGVGGVLHWSTRTMAKAQGVSEGTFRRIWHQHGLQPHRVTRFKLSKDPRFVDKLRDVVGLYLNPPDKAVVFCVDEKSGIQALDRTRPVLPLMRNVPERQTHDYIRHGTTCLYAALRVLDGTVFGTCRPKRDSKEFVRFLDQIEVATPADQAIHVILDNLSTHKSPPVQRWLRRHPRAHFHFIPTSSSWLNLVERWFGEITRQRIRRGTFESVADLVAAIDGYLAHYNTAPRRFIWTKDADTILGKIDRCQKVLNARD